MSDGLHVVHVRVVDAATNRPSPVRIRFQDRGGRRYVPLGQVATFPTGESEDVGLQVRLGDRDYAYIDGSCEILLPPDPVEVEIVKAEYGAGSNQTDVTETLRKQVGSLVLIALSNASYNASFGGDPAPGAVKQLKVQYKIYGKPSDVSFAEDAAIILPMPE